VRVEIVVDELVVRGLAAEEARAAAAALEARLTALAAGSADAIQARSEYVRRLPAVAAASPAGVGEAVAGAVWQGLKS
jgi:ABC-type enterobactin transport system permease subunit